MLRSSEQKARSPWQTRCRGWNYLQLRLLHECLLILTGLPRAMQQPGGLGAFAPEVPPAAFAVGGWGERSWRRGGELLVDLGHVVPLAGREVLLLVVRDGVGELPEALSRARSAVVAVVDFDRLSKQFRGRRLDHVIAVPDHAPLRQNNQGRVGGPKILAPLSCALTIGALWDTSKYKKVSCSEPLGVTILLLGYSKASLHRKYYCMHRKVEQKFRGKPHL